MSPGFGLVVRLTLRAADAAEAFDALVSRTVTSLERPDGMPAA
ncbi:hypothetical protein Q3V23_11520 [Streptomyces sp. VNUA116]|nr:hypothetical protein [Streptomyces sp. VNUA116]WKU44652.1 hypothetical protein Q3V23_11520 [Streptomyces sp. VNUA116]